MNYETGKKDPTLKFSSGPFKGRPLDDTGIPYRIIEWADESSGVALFRNGSRAKFYQDHRVPVEPDPVLPRDPVDQREARRNGGTVGALEDLAHETLRKHMPVRPPAPEHGARLTLHALRDARMDRLIDDPRDPAYCARRGDDPSHFYCRGEVGTGIREFLWLYRTFRKPAFGRTRRAAFREAFNLYFS